MASGYLGMAQRARRKTVEAEPFQSPAPCPRCGCAIVWRAESEVLTCAACQPKPSGSVTKMVLVEFESGSAWEPYPTTAAAEPDAEMIDATWEDGDEIVPCPSCGSLMAWWDARDRRRCMACDPPTKARMLIRERDQIVRQEQLQQKRPKPPK